MKISQLAALTVTFLASTFASAQACEYVVHREACVTIVDRLTPTTVEILVVEGAKDTSDDLCIGNVARAQAENPQAINVRWIEGSRRDQEVSASNVVKRLGGYKKKDVFCSYAMELPQTHQAEGPECAVASVERQGCEILSAEQARTCVAAPVAHGAELWIKAACMADALIEAPRIAGMDMPTYNELGFKTEMLKNSLPLSAEDNDRRVGAYLSSRLGQ